MQDRKTITGVVVGTGMEKTVAVLVERTGLDEQYHKYIRRQKKYLAHDEKNTCAIGDRVAIRECRPLSKRKRWRVVRIEEKIR